MAEVRVHTQRAGCCFQPCRQDHNTVFCGSATIAILMLCLDSILTVGTAATHGVVFSFVFMNACSATVSN
jgi:hypothetical protein